MKTVISTLFWIVLRLRPYAKFRYRAWSTVQSWCLSISAHDSLRLTFSIPMPWHKNTYVDYITWLPVSVDVSLLGLWQDCDLIFDKFTRDTILRDDSSLFMYNGNEELRTPGSFFISNNPRYVALRSPPLFILISISGTGERATTRDLFWCEHEGCSVTTCRS